MSDSDAREVAALRDGDALEAMMASPGWQVLKRELDRRTMAALHALRSCRTWENTCRQQGLAEGLDEARQLAGRLAEQLRKEPG